MKAFWALIGLLLVLPWAAGAQVFSAKQFMDVTIWAVNMNSAGSSTTTYTVDCMWW